MKKTIGILLLTIFVVFGLRACKQKKECCKGKKECTAKPCCDKCEGTCTADNKCCDKCNLEDQKACCKKSDTDSTSASCHKKLVVQMLPNLVVTNAKVNAHQTISAAKSVMQNNILLHFYIYKGKCFAFAKPFPFISSTKMAIFVPKK
ncbi:MAG: hypothetical protein IPK18_06430 [Sphingobacteriales bacterium]|nr:MAG: hypothetical protein IPK18_06430 [Sphingobacteriales bacterium]